MQQADYHARLEQAVLLLEGKHQSLCQELREKMEAAAEELRFERAAEPAINLRAIMKLLGQKQLVTAGTMADTDVIGWYQTEAKACFAVLHFIEGATSWIRTMSPACAGGAGRRCRQLVKQ